MGDNVVNRQGIILQLMLLMEEEEAEYEEMMLAIAEIAALEMLLLEGVLQGEQAPPWFYFTVHIDEYRQLGDPSFKMHFRMSRFSWYDSQPPDEKGRLQRERTPLLNVMLMVVWVLATPDSFRSVASRFGVNPSTLWYFYSYVIEALRELAPNFIRWPDAEERADIANAFQGVSGFPGAVGCIDGTHCHITAPVQHKRQFVNRQHQYSINTQCVVDHKLLVRHLHVGEVGSMHDQRVFRRSRLSHMLLQRGEDRIVEPDQHILGDGGYTLTDYLMTPFDNNGNLTAEQVLFNRSLSSNRVKVENAFARAKMKWRRMIFLHARNHSIVIDHITASFVLHNFTLLHGEQVWEAGEWERHINDDEVLGDVVQDEELDEDYEDPDLELQLEAEMRGEEKRLHIMNNVLAPWM